MTINVKLKYLNGDAANSEMYHVIDQVQSIIGRGSPSFINDSRISRKHAEIVVSQELSNVMYIQLGQNGGKLVRPNSNGSNGITTIKLVKGQPPTSLKHGDTLFLCDSFDRALTVIIEDDYVEPMETNVEDELATQVDPLDDWTNNVDDDDDNETIEIRKERGRSREDDENDDEDNNNHKEDDGEIIQQPFDRNKLKKLRYHNHPATIPDTTSTTTTLNTNTNITNNTNINQQQQFIKPSQPQQIQKQSSPIYVADDLRVNLSEDELTFIRKLGQGSCGEVSQYEWRGTQVAVKIIFRSLIHKEKNGEFEKETQILKCLRHPNVVLFMGTCLLKGNLAIITEYLNRGSLRDVLNSKSIQLSWNTKIKMCLDVAQGMNYLHSYTPKIIHRDLKSLNLLVDNNYNVKVSDFGLSRFSTGNEAKTFCGTLPWIAPEVFTRSGYSTKADVFSYGVVLWEILTKKEPIGNIASSVNGYPDIPTDCPIPYAQLIKDCCAKVPDHRPNFTQIINRLKSMFVIQSNNQNDLNQNNNQNNSTNNQQNNNNLINNNNNQNVGGGEGSGGKSLEDSSLVQKQSLLEWKIESNEITDIVFVKKTENYTLFRGTYKSKPVALKTFQQSIQEFETKELALLASLSKLSNSNRSCVTFHGVVYNNDEYAIVFDMYGQSLLDHMKDTNVVFNWSHTLDLSLQIANSINTLHHSKPTIFHRGITSECFVFDLNINNNNSELKVTDFGLSRFNIHENLLSLGQIKGNFIYSPPELFKSIKYSSKSDVYSFSIVLWELVQRCITSTYQIPFSNIKLDYDFQIIHQTSKFNKRPVIDEQLVPLQISKLLRMCWDADPQLRPDMDRIINTLKDIKDKLVTQPPQ